MKLLKLTMVLILGLSQATAFGESILKAINPGDTFVRLPKAAKKVARVRLGVKLIPYEKLVVTDAEGVNKIRYAKSTPIRRNLRSRIDKKTDFYINNWHVELEPIAWDKNIKKLNYRVRLFKQYGQGGSLEEQIGAIEVEGLLEGSRFVYSFSGKNSVKFNNKSGIPIAELYVQEPFGPSRKMNVARKKAKSVK